jgi:hypothetical protein
VSKAKKRTIIWLLIAVTIYSVGYLPIREARWVVHRAGYVTGQDGKMVVAAHYVSMGDFGAPMLNPVGSLIQYAVATVYWPIREIEKVYWGIKVPPGSPWPQEWKLRDRG